jgi:hypothetical protein
VPVVIISPALVPSMSPLKVLSIDMRPTGTPATFSSSGSGFTLTSNVPTAWLVMVVPFGEGGFEGLVVCVQAGGAQSDAPRNAIKVRSGFIGEW